MRRFLKRVLKVGVLAGAGYAVWRYFEKRRSDSGVGWEPQPFPYPPQPRTTDPFSTEETQVDVATPVEPAGGVERAPAPDAAWVEPNGDVCPTTHPVKAKLSSKIFHVPGGQSYDRTKPDRCYRDPAAAEVDGLRRAAR
ncbi:MAG: hypothetical protein ACRDY4_05105 [Acidimicrobiia bacterium]